MKKRTKRFLTGILISFLLSAAGFVLRMIWFPVQDIDLMSEAELTALQREIALNCPLGTALYYVGAVLSVICIILYVYHCFRDS